MLFVIRRSNLDEYMGLRSRSAMNQHPHNWMKRQDYRFPRIFITPKGPPTPQTIRACFRALPQVDLDQRAGIENRDRASSGTRK